MTEPIAITRQGQVRGVEKAGLLNFRGIPFVAPPVGPLRFRAPEPPEPWDGIRDATQNGPISLQAPPSLDLPGGPAAQRPMAEDCLTLNVWAPATSGALPVMVWIHGGAFTIGCGADFSGRDLAARGAVVVTINYRLGPLGFLTLPCFADEQGRFTNFGLRDQVAALRWVRENAAAFGGDSGNVTIFGESAGGMSVGALMASPEARGLFHRAIAQSGAGHHAITLEAATATARRICEILGVSPDDAAGLRAAPAADLIQAASKLETEDRQHFIGRGRVWKPTFAPVADGQALRALPISAINGGDGSDVPLLVGSNADEYRALVTVAPLTEPEVAGRFAELGLDGKAAFETYAEARRERGELASPEEIWQAALTDHHFRVPADRLAEANAARGNPSYSYLFDWKSPPQVGLGAYHGFEIMFMSGIYRLFPDQAGNGPAADALANTMMDAWVAFATNGDPSTPSVHWPRFETGTRPIMVLGEKCYPTANHREAERRAWDGVIP